MSKRPPVPRHEPETIAAAAKPWRGDTEKVPTTAVDGLIVSGVALSSRYGKAEELETMARMVELLPASLTPLIDSIFCDSKAMACYSVQLHRSSRAQAEEIAEQLGRLANQVQGGHNGIDVNAVEGGQIYVSPGWAGDFEE